MTEPSDVLIVGAGMAGLSAARALDRAGLRVVVVEARDRVGGRMHSLARDGGAIDLGATWFWENEPLVQSLLTEFGLRAFAQAAAGDMLFVQAGGRIHRLPSSQLGGGTSWRIADGAQALPDAMAAALPPGILHLNAPVHSIAVNAHGVTVASSAGTFTAGHAIVAMPPSLALEAIAFTPPLPDAFARVARQTSVWMGDMVKTVATYERPFWREQGLSGTALSEAGPFREVHDHSGAEGRPAALFGFAPAASMAGVDGDAIRTAFIDQLAGLFGRDAARPRDVMVENWNDARYTSPRERWPEASPSTYGHPVFHAGDEDARIVWASTETAVAFAGHVEGAIRAGLLAAEAVRRNCDRSR